VRRGSGRAVGSGASAPRPGRAGPFGARSTRSRSASAAGAGGLGGARPAAPRSAGPRAAARRASTRSPASSCSGSVSFTFEVGRLGYALSDARVLAERLDQELHELTIELAAETVPARLEQAALERTGLRPPAPGQVVILK
jgi:hypothetical protein